MNQLKIYIDCVKGISFFLALAVLLAAMTGWQGTYFGYAAHTATKAQYLHAVLVFFSVIIGIVITFCSAMLVLDYFLKFALQKFPMLQPKYTLSDYIKGISLFILSAAIAYGIMAIVVYKN